MGISAETRVLIVEDEPLLRMTAVDILEDAGFVVEEACDSREALAILHRVPNIHVLFTDVQMPGDIDGLALAHLTAREFPGVGVIIVSGHRRLEAHEMPRRATFLAKPYEARRVVHHIHQARQTA